MKTSILVGSREAAAEQAPHTPPHQAKIGLAGGPGCDVAYAPSRFGVDPSGGGSSEETQEYGRL